VWRKQGVGARWNEGDVRDMRDMKSTCRRMPLVK